MAYLTTKKQFDALNDFEKRDVASLLLDAHKSFTFVTIELRKPPKGLDMSRIYSAQFSCDFNMKDYVRMNNKIAKQSVAINTIKTWLN